MNSDRTFIENNIEDNFCQKHEKCLSCKYNTVRKKSTDNFNMYNCEAEVDKFDCDLIPELYPDKLAKLPDSAETLDGKIEVQNEESLSLYEVWLYDIISENYKTFPCLGNGVKQIQEVILKRLDKPCYSNYRLYKIKNFSEFLGYDIIAVPKNVTKLYYPHINVDIEDRENVDIDSIRLEVIRKASVSEEHDETNTVIKVLGKQI